MRNWLFRALAALTAAGCTLMVVGCADGDSDQPLEDGAGTSQVLAPPASEQPVDGSGEGETVEREVFFADEDERGPGNPNEMVAVSRAVPAGSGLAGAIKALLDGPTPEEKVAGSYSVFGQDRSGLLRDAGVDGAVAWVDFEDEVMDINNLTTSNAMRVMRLQLRETAASFGADRVKLMIEGSAERWCNEANTVCDA